jgi:photosystem II stability/assembly factor-like uncharacterized protein
VKRKNGRSGIKPLEACCFRPPAALWANANRLTVPADGHQCLGGQEPARRWLGQLDSYITPKLRIANETCLVLAAAILLSGAATVGGAEWSEIGSGLPRTIAGVTSLTIDPATPSTLYAVDIGGRLFKSIDSGGSWKLRGSVRGVGFIAVDPKNSSTIYASTNRGVLNSTDGGDNWAGANSGLAGNDVSMIAIDPVTPATLYAAASHGIFKSTDAARSWNRIDTLPREAYLMADAPYYFHG